jgi:hypothetical protein
MAKDFITSSQSGAQLPPFETPVCALPYPGGFGPLLNFTILMNEEAVINMSAKEGPWLCFNKTLFTKTSKESDLIWGHSLPTPVVLQRLDAGSHS